jgi:hypothetical protein
MDTDEHGDTRIISEEKKRNGKFAGAIHESSLLQHLGKASRGGEEEIL